MITQIKLVLIAMAGGRRACDLIQSVYAFNHHLRSTSAPEPAKFRFIPVVTNELDGIDIVAADRNCVLIVGCDRVNEDRILHCWLGATEHRTPINYIVRAPHTRPLHHREPYLPIRDLVSYLGYDEDVTPMVHQALGLYVMTEGGRVEQERAALLQGSKEEE